MNVFSLKMTAIAVVAINFCILYSATRALGQTGDTARALVGSRRDSAKKKIRPYREVVPASARTSHGFFLIHKVEDHYLMEIPDSLLGRDLLVVNRIVEAPGGPSVAKVLL